MPTSISDLWSPDIWIRDINEKVATFPSLISSPCVVRTAQFDALAAGPGTSANMPYFRDISDQADAIQVENTQPARQVIGSGKQFAPILDRVTANDSTALAAQVSGANPAEAISGQISFRRQKQRQTTLVSVLRGIFNFAGAVGAAAPLLPVRNDIYSETGAAPPAGQLISPTAFINTAALLGERSADLGGGILMHSAIRAALLIQDQISFTQYSTQEGIKLELYKGLRTFVSDALVRNGGVSGKVYDTYIFGVGVFGWGEKAQQGDTIDAASLSYWEDKQKNNWEIYDRTRFVLHPNGLKWTGTPAGQSATNAELATVGNWSLDYTTANRCSIACLRSNG